MKVCVIGSGGLIGTHLCRALNRRGHAIIGFTRRTSCPLGLQFVDWIPIGDRALEELLPRLGFFDLVVDLHAYEPAGLAGLVCRIPSITTHWIHISTIYVYRRLSEAWSRPHSNAFLPVPIPEDFRCEPSGPYGTGKHACEKVLLAAMNSDRAPVTIVRLPFIYGPGDRSNRIAFYIDRIRENKPIPLPNRGENRIDLVFAADLAEVVCRIAETNASIGNLYNIAVSPAVSLRTHVEILASLLGGRALIEQALDASVPFAFPRDIVLDNSKLLQLLGQVNATPLIESWRYTLEAELHSHRASDASERYFSMIPNSNS